MSYCRWSSDDWRSDLYVYEGEDGIVIHIRCMRKLFSREGLTEIDLTAEHDTQIDQWMTRHKEVMERIKDCPMEKVGLSHDGETIYCEPHDAADIVMDLAREGYHVPDGVVEELEEDFGDGDE